MTDGLGRVLLTREGDSNWRLPGAPVRAGQSAPAAALAALANAGVQADGLELFWLFVEPDPAYGEVVALFCARADAGASLPADVAFFETGKVNVADAATQRRIQSANDGRPPFEL